MSNEDLVEKLRGCADNIENGEDANGMAEIARDTCIEFLAGGSGEVKHAPIGE